ncbi:MAG: peptide deformylase [Bacteroidota bacterium]
MPILPIVTYNDEVLREVAKPVTEDSPEVQKLIDDMLETMYNADGLGLAAPQIGKSVQIFVMDPDPVLPEDMEDKPGALVCINPEILEKSGDKIPMDEGCLSIPEVTDKVSRPETITITYLDRTFNEHTETYDGWISRIIQHEYDHLQGVLFVDYLSLFRRRMHRKDLAEIQSGEREAKYPILPKI